jgi:hypothetical protein
MCPLAQDFLQKQDYLGEHVFRKFSEAPAEMRTMPGQPHFTYTDLFRAGLPGNHRQYFTYFSISKKNRAELLLESQVNIIYDFFKNFKSTFQALKWAFVFPKGQKSA